MFSAFLCISSNKSKGLFDIYFLFLIMEEQNQFKEEIIKYIKENDKNLEVNKLNDLPIVQLVIMKTELELKNNSLT